jgi:hypothetical protein
MYLQDLQNEKEPIINIETTRRHFKNLDLDLKNGRKKA